MKNTCITLLVGFCSFFSFTIGILIGTYSKEKQASTSQITIKQVNLTIDRAYYLGWYKGFERGYDAGYLRKYTDIQMETTVKHLFYQYDSIQYQQSLNYMDITKTLNFDE